MRIKFKKYKLTNIWFQQNFINMVKFMAGLYRQDFTWKTITFKQRTFVILILVETMVVLNNSSTCTLMVSVEFP